MPSTTFILQRGDDEFDLEIEFDHTPFDPGRISGPPEDCYPPEGGEIEKLEAFLDGKKFELSAQEEEAVEAHIYDTYDFSDAYDFAE